MPGPTLSSAGGRRHLHLPQPPRGRAPGLALVVSPPHSIRHPKILRAAPEGAKSAESPGLRQCLSSLHQREPAAPGASPGPGLTPLRYVLVLIPRPHPDPGFIALVFWGFPSVWDFIPRPFITLLLFFALSVQVGDYFTPVCNGHRGGYLAPPALVLPKQPPLRLGKPLRAPLSHAPSGE